MFKAYRGVGEILGRYWRHYGGIRAIAGSPYFHAAAVMTVCLVPYWVQQPWWELAIATIPSILGFSLGGYAIWLALGDERFRTLITIRAEDHPTSPYMEVSAAFAHFVVLQFLALLGALVAEATQFDLTSSLLGPIVPSAIAKHIPTIAAPVGYCLGFLIFSYALLSALATALTVFRVASWYDQVQHELRTTPSTTDEP